MPVGTCDPASRGELWNFGELVAGDVRITYRYGWDGVSTRDGPAGCVGPLNRLRCQNLSATATWYAHFRGRRGQPRVVALTPGFDQTWTGGQLSSRGFDTNSDLENLRITDSPTPPEPGTPA